MKTGHPQQILESLTNLNLLLVIAPQAEVERDFQNDWMGRLILMLSEITSQMRFSSCFFTRRGCLDELAASPAPGRDKSKHEQAPAAELLPALHAGSFALCTPVKSHFRDWKLTVSREWEGKDGNPSDPPKELPQKAPAGGDIPRDAGTISGPFKMDMGTTHPATHQGAGGG